MHFLLRNRALLVIFGLLSVVIFFLFAGFIYFLTEVSRKPREPNPADAIVVLTGGPLRIEHALKLLAQGKGKRLLISGVHPTTTKRDLSRLVPQHKELFKCCIDIDHLALNTIGNASQTRDWVQDRGFRSVIVVTASYHMPRSMLELKRVLPKVRLIPFPVLPQKVHLDNWWAYPGTLWLLAKEYLKTFPALIRLGATRINYYVAD